MRRGLASYVKTASSRPFPTRATHSISTRMIARQILLLRVNALIGGIGADSIEEARELAQQLTDGIPDVVRRSALAGEMSGYLLAIRMVSDGQWGSDPRPEARGVLAQIEAEHQKALADAARRSLRRPLFQRTAGSLRRLLKRPEHGHS